MAPFLVVGFVALGISLEFVKINNKPLIYNMQAFVYFFIHPRLYVWRPEQKKKEVERSRDTSLHPIAAPDITQSKLKDLAWRLDIQDRSRKP
jgi:hypothetical protein